MSRWSNDDLIFGALIEADVWHQIRSLAVANIFRLENNIAAWRAGDSTARLVAKAKARPKAKAKAKAKAKVKAKTKGKGKV